jgi:hypothetical protein
MFVLAALALAASTPAPLLVANDPSLAAAGSFDVCDGAARLDDDSSDFLPPADLSTGAPGAEPTAICRLFPECWSDSDCDARCGVGQGKCVHSNCPPRLCKCR